ncbi:MAG TPA: tetratricopeptide repeat protein [Bacteroidales bacterium]|nr:tetratricopeptide repeat protein [Bacteroidales bacterium]HQB19216.1 tetratricopeptide repeat protein [Bacteroidales bacterium]
MKKFVFTIGLVTLVTLSMAQRKELSNAYNHYSNKYWSRAKTAIDKAAEHEDTKNDARTWFYRGNIYLQIGYAKQENPNSEYKNLCDNCGEIAYDSYVKALQIDKTIEASTMMPNNPIKGIDFCTDLLYNETLAELNKNNFERALVLAEKCYNSNPHSESGNFIYAVAAEYANKKDIAKARYSAMINRKKPTLMFEPYIQLALIYKEENDTARALKAIKARPAEDTTFNIKYVINKSVILTWAGETEEATAIMDEALAKDPNNHLLLFGLGTAFSDQKKYEEAEKYLNKALEIKPNDVNIVYNLGNSYYNHYAEKFNKMDEIEDNDEYEKEKQECQVLLRKALPLLEKAHEMDPEDRNTLIMLKTIYPRIDTTTDEEKEAFSTKLKAVDEKLK